MDNALLYRQLKLTQDASLDDLVLLIQKIAKGVGRDLNLPSDCIETLVEDLPMRVFKHWYQYPQTCKHSVWIYSIARNQALASLPYYQAANSQTVAANNNAKIFTENLVENLSHQELTPQPANALGIAYDQVIDKLMPYLAQQCASYAEQHNSPLGTLHEISYPMTYSHFTARFFITDHAFNDARLIEDWFYQFGIWNSTVNHMLRDGFNLEDFEDTHRVWDVHFAIPEALLYEQGSDKDH